MSNAIDARRVIQELESLLESLPSDPMDSSGVKGSERKKLRHTIEQAIEALQRTLSGLDPIRQPPHILDPSDPDVIGKLIADTLLIQPRHKLSDVSKFYGSGVYAIYYTGAFSAYDLITGTDKPIYVGKADPATSDAISPSAQGITLWRRLQDHRKTISAATTTLDVTTFDCRFLVVRSAWQGTAETYLIDRFKPVWNNEVGICYGFGKHGDSAKTRSNTRSPWDTLHPGRRWGWQRKQTESALRGPDSCPHRRAFNKGRGIELKMGNELGKTNARYLRRPFALSTVFILNRSTPLT